MTNITLDRITMIHAHRYILFNSDDFLPLRTWVALQLFTNNNYTIDCQVTYGGLHIQDAH